ncbi:MAG TPA: hypothetical protein EYP53_06695 [Candidatus Latescibacteria bacterium]|nr:hypothetical protein [Candidatus Latescibacterota bacterium]
MNMPKGTLRKLRQKTESWSALTPDQIIAQPTIRPIVSQGGYHQEGIKEAIVWTNDHKFSGTFQLIDIEVYEVVYTGELKDGGRHIWGGNNLIADFTTFTRPGRYKVRLDLKGTDQVIDSITFPIRPAIYFELGRKGAKWYSYQRCGTEVPGWHPPCHTDDGLLNGKPFDATGGWHDGGDYNKWTHYAHYGLFALAAIYEDFPERWQAEKGTLPYPLDEMVWEAEYICKVQMEDGTLLSAVGVKDDPWFWEGVPEKEPTRRLSADYGGKSYANTTLVGASMGRLARILRSEGYDEAAVARYIEVARRGYERGRGVDFSKVESRTRNEYLETQAGLLLADIELYKLTDKEDYQADACDRVERILAAQGDQGFFYSDLEKKNPYYNAGFYQFALYEFLKANPVTPLKGRIVDSFARWAAFIEPLAGLSNFGQIGGLAEDGSRRNLHRGTGSIYITSAGWAMATAAMLLGSKDYLPIAERQIQWIVGYNPTEISLMAGVGQGPGCYHTRMAACEGHEDGAIPGGILNGIRGSDGGVVDIGDARTNSKVIADHLPVDYPLIDTDTYGWTYAYIPNEYWVPNNGWFILAATRVEKALVEV